MQDDGTILNFCNHFWGKEERGVDVLFGRMNEAKNICEEIRVFYKDWATIEEEYARRLRRLVRGTLGSHEIGTMRESFDTLQKETETIAKQHSNVALQIRGELEEPLHAFSSDMRTNRKAIQSNLEKLRRIKIAQVNQVQKCKEKIEDKSGKASGQASQLSLFLGKSSEKNNQKVDKSQIMAQNNNDYLLAITVLQETSIKWIREWKIACDKFQDLEERRLDFIKSSLWTFSGIISETCISDSKGFFKLFSFIIFNQFILFIRTKGTGQEIPNPPKSKDPYNNGFEDLNDPTCSIAQFSRVSDPQFHSDAIMQRSIFNENSVYLSPKISSFISNSQPEPSLKTDVNKVPFDGITQLCKSDSLLDSSNTKRFSPTASAYPHSNETQVAAPLFNYRNHDEKDLSMASKTKKKDRNSFNINDKRLGYLSSMEETANEINQTGYRSTLSYKNSSIKKNCDTAKSPLFERLKGMGVVSDSEIESIDPRANVMLNAGNNLFKIETDGKKKKLEIHSSEDPIVTALNQFKVSSKMSPKKEPRVSWHDPIDDNNIQNPEIMGRRHYFPSEPQKPPLNIRSSIPVPQKPALSIPNKFVKRDPLSASPSSIPATKMKHMTQAYTKQVNDIYSTSEKDIYPLQYGTMPMNNNDFCYGHIKENMFSEKEVMSMAKGKNHNTRLGSSENMLLSEASERPYMDYRRVLGASSPQLEYRTISPENDYPRSGSRSPIAYKSTPPGAYHPSRIGRPMEPFQDDRISRPLTLLPATESPDHFYNRVSRRQPPVSSAFDISLDADGNLINKYSRARSASPCPSSYRAISRSKYNMHTEHIPYSTSIPSGYGDYYNEDTRIFNSPLSHNDKKTYMNNGLAPSQYTKDGKRILFYVRALYDYMAAIPEEISFVKNDVLLVLDMQEDGWWEGEVLNSKNSKRGLFPSNFVQRTTFIS
ncbi:hypothetical protein PNEG_00721 [Pneumocystis murina B123]|uniref:SH3 domain-containing protein n=1 Tax=Pneumocystis murina (strain B123) TaxID=1069680 RepID=M7PB60_PNEMU|nr:hypothetical protein PNEG_00721 [Pneumocystis murina B123]EMR11125.1 hypothetical protein PNEG_00721 [Pneumocystis murina B123]